MALVEILEVLWKWTQIWVFPSIIKILANTRIFQNSLWMTNKWTNGKFKKSIWIYIRTLEMFRTTWVQQVSWIYRSVQYLGKQSTNSLCFPSNLQKFNQWSNNGRMQEFSKMVCDPIISGQTRKSENSYQFFLFLSHNIWNFMITLILLLWLWKNKRTNST